MKEEDKLSWIETEGWKYFRCGSRHILFEPVGKLACSKGLLLRVRRRNACLASLSVKEEQRFVKDFFGASLGLSYLPITEVVYVSTEFLRNLSSSLHSIHNQVNHSHVKFLEEPDVDISSHLVILIRDQRKLVPPANISNEELVCVEWKPKYVLLPRSRLIPVPISNYKYCYYRCNLKDFRERSSLTYYNPEDIFSFQNDKVRQALYSLIRQKSKYLQLLHPYQQEPVSYSVLETKLDILVHIICKEAALLSNIRRIQQLDILDYEGAKLTLEALNENLERLEKRIYEKIFPCNWLKEELDYLNCHNELIFRPDEEQRRMEWCFAADTEKLEESFHRGRNYLLSLNTVELERILGDFLYSTIMKDCSILITFVQVSKKPDEEPRDMWKTLYVGERMYYYCISVIDLEPKSLKKLNMWLESDRFLFNLCNICK